MGFFLAVVLFKINKEGSFMECSVNKERLTTIRKLADRLSLILLDGGKFLVYYKENCDILIQKCSVCGKDTEVVEARISVCGIFDADLFIEIKRTNDYWGNIIAAATGQYQLGLQKAEAQVWLANDTGRNPDDIQESEILPLMGNVPCICEECKQGKIISRKKILMDIWRHGASVAYVPKHRML